MVIIILKHVQSKIQQTSLDIMMTYILDPYYGCK